MNTSERDDREVVLVEDEKNLAELVRDVLAADGITVRWADNVAEASNLLEHHAPDLLIFDLKLPDGDGLDLLERVRKRGLAAPAIIITAFGTVERAVQAMRAGASDFLVKPFDNARLRSAVAFALESARAVREAEIHAGVLGTDTELGRQLIGAGGGLKDVVALLGRVASTDATVLIHGESGTGKQVVARAIHESSHRVDGQFVSIDCSAIPATLIESELFGFERGSFTGAHAQRKGLFEAADGGTLFLDEIGDMPLEAQSRLLHVLQEREITRIGGRSPIKVDVRVIAATHRNLAELARSGAFRQDLWYRLNVVPIFLPPLRERPEDIAGLVEHFMEKHGGRFGATISRTTPELIDHLKSHSWPGNVRELENFVERSLVLGRFDLSSLRASSLPSSPPPKIEPLASDRDDRSPLPTLRQAVADAERSAVVRALRRAKGNKAEAARLLGISYKTLFNKIHEHDIKEAVMIE
jgi:DNA-binding NtrC family response regulator